MNEFEALQIVLHPMRNYTGEQYLEAVNVIERHLKLGQLYKEKAHILGMFKNAIIPSSYLIKLHELEREIEELEK